MNVIKKVVIKALSCTIIFSACSMDQPKKQNDLASKRFSSPYLRISLENSIRDRFFLHINQLTDRSTPEDIAKLLEFITHDRSLAEIALASVAKCHAAYSWIIPIVEQLIVAGAHVNGVDEAGRTALHFASMCNNVELAKLLVKYRADVNIPTKRARYVPLHAASACGYVDFFDVLMQAGADPSVCDMWGVTPLHGVMGRGQESADGVYQMIFPRREDVYDRRRKFYLSQIESRSYMIEKLVEKGASNQAQDVYGKSPPDYAEDYGHSELSSKLLEETMRSLRASALFG